MRRRDGPGEKFAVTGVEEDGPCDAASGKIKHHRGLRRTDA